MTKPANILKQADIFDGLTPTHLDMIAMVCQEQVYQAGELIFPESATGDELFVIIQGEVDIQVNPGLITNHPGGRASVTVATLRRAQSFGEIALVDQGVRSAAAVATQNDTRLLVFPRAKLMELCEKYPQLGYRLMYNLAADLAFKMRNTDLKICEEMLYRPRENHQG